jgi:short-subunit dehydrogenase
MATFDTPQVVAITGASSGIGRATAAHFARKGWRVGLIARGEDGLDAARADVIAEGGTAAIAVADVADAAALEAAAQQIEATLGPIDVWVNNAGTSVYGEFAALDPDEFRRVTDVTYLGAVNGTRVALKRMQPRDRGTIVNVCSAIAYRAAPLQSAYSGAKYALRGFTEAVRSELIHNRSRVHLTMVHPPSTNTPFFNHAANHLPTGGVPRPPPPVYQPEITADAIFFAATHRRREVMVTGETVAFAWANKLALGLTDLLMGLTGYATQTSRKPGLAEERDEAVDAPGHRPSRVHGPLDSEALGWSAQMWATKNRGALALGLGLVALAALARPALAARR